MDIDVDDAPLSPSTFQSPLSTGTDDFASMSPSPEGIDIGVPPVEGLAAAADGEAAAESAEDGGEEEEGKLPEIETPYVDLRLRDGVQNPYPYVLDTRRVYSYTKLRFYRRSRLHHHVGEVCLYGASIHRPDPLRPVYHIRVPNFTYYIRTSIHAAEDDPHVAAIEKWIDVANTPYTNVNQVFLTVAFSFPQPPMRRGSNEPDPQGYLTKGTVRVGAGAEKAVELDRTTKYLVVLVRLHADRPQRLMLGLTHTLWGELAHHQPIRLWDLLGWHSQGASDGYTVQLFDKARRQAGSASITWDIAPDRHIRLGMEGYNLWRKDFVRSDPFLRVRRKPAGQPRRAGQKSSNGALVYRSEGYQNLAHPEFLPIIFAVPPVYVMKPWQAGCPEEGVVVMVYSARDAPMPVEDGAAAGRANEDEKPAPATDWLTEIAGRDDTAAARSRFQHMMRKADGEDGETPGGATPFGEALPVAQDVPQKVLEAIRQKLRLKTALNDNDSEWPAVNLTDTLTVEWWDNHHSRRKKQSHPTPIGELEFTLQAALGNVNLMLEPCGELKTHVTTLQIVRSAKYNDNEAPRGEKTRGHQLITDYDLREGTGNAQSTILHQRDARSRSTNSRMKLTHASLHERPSFLHFLKARWCIETCICLDLTQGSHALHRSRPIVPGHNIFQLLMAQCVLFLAPLTGRGGADLYGFAGVVPAAEYQVFPIHKQTHVLSGATGPRGSTAADARRRSKRRSCASRRSMASKKTSVANTASDRDAGTQGESDSDENAPQLNQQGIMPTGADAVDLTGGQLQLGYGRARDQIGRLMDTFFPVFLLPVLRTCTARTEEVIKARKEYVQATEQAFFQELERVAAGARLRADDLEALEEMAQTLDTLPQHGFAVNVIMIANPMEMADLNDAVDELRALEASKSPCLFYLIFIDCTAPHAFHSLLNCITVDVNTSPMLLQGSLELMARGLGYLPSRFIDYMRLHRVSPEPPGTSYKSYIEAVAAQLGTAGDSDDAEEDASVSDAEGAGYPFAVPRTVAPRAQLSNAAARPGTAHPHAPHAPAPPQRAGSAPRVNTGAAAAEAPHPPATARARGMSEQTRTTEADSEEEAMSTSTLSSGGLSGESGATPRRPLAPNDAAPRPHAGGDAKKRSDFYKTSARFNQMFDCKRLAKPAVEAEQRPVEDEEAAVADPFEDMFSAEQADDTRYKKAVSTKGHEVFAMVSQRQQQQQLSRKASMRSQRASRSSRALRSKSNSGASSKELKVVDLYMTDAELRKKERTDQRLREYLLDRSEPDRRRKSSGGLEKLHTKFLRMREEDQAKAAGVGTATRRQSHRGSMASNVSGYRRASVAGVRTPQKGRGARLKGKRKQSSVCSSASSTDKEDESPLARITGIVAAAHKAQCPTRKMARRGSQQAFGDGASEGDGATASSDGETDYDAVVQQMLAEDAGADGRGRPRLQQRKQPKQVTYYAYDGPHGGAPRPPQRAYDCHQKEYRTLQGGLRVDWRLDRDKQAELRRILKEQQSIHAGPPIEPKAAPANPAPRLSIGSLSTQTTATQRTYR
eukprot:TRINITY_DN15718_c0_g1_i1.p1 TRINITY_DN15718_c0_g1~~TRINITY_DN15718_c0_g1_i1.p1  ORF type:complete len:1549 (+),score=558.08 TRINITY_DN15718_c0_g1_i1:60-4706(+)